MEKIIKLFEENLKEKVSSIKQLSGGLSNIIYLINEKYIWKIINKNTMLEIENEIKLLKKLDNYILYYEDDNNICYNYLEGSNITLNYYINNFKEIILLTKEYHNNKFNRKDKNFWKNIIKSWLDLLPNDINFTRKDVLVEYYNKIDEELKKINLEDDLVLGHHDIHKGNIIINKDKLFLIDLEFSYTSYYFIDLGNIICEYYTDYDNEIYNYNNFNNKIIDLIKINYDKNDNLIDKKLKLGIIISHYYWCVWGIIKAIKNKNSFDYNRFAEIRYKELKKYFKISY